MHPKIIPASTPAPLAWKERKHFGALDWARDHHDIAVVDGNGTIVCELRFEHTPEGWQSLHAALAPFGPSLAIAVETNQGLAVEQLLDAGDTVYPVNPKSAVRYRERKAPAGAKDDQRDAWSLADALRVDGHAWKPLVPDDPLVAELRLLTRDEVALIGQRTALVNQLRAALGAYYPAALAAFDTWTCAGCWTFVETFPTPAALVKAGPKKWEKFLRQHQLWKEATREKRLAIFAAAESLGGAPGTVAAKSLLAVSLARILHALQTQLDAYRERIQERFSQHPDSGLFGSLPGAGVKLAPRLLAELGDNRARFATAEGLQAYAGTAPVTFQSGQIEKHLVRRACQPFLRSALHLWADRSRLTCAWADDHYRAHRAKGQSHACALRCLGQRSVKILWKMWQTSTPFDEARHLANQRKHGSPFAPAPVPKNA
jgi:transposase